MSAPLAEQTVCRELALQLTRGRYGATFARTPDQVTAAQALRFRAFFPAQAAFDGLDQDAFDAIAHHVLIRDHRLDSLVACFRVQFHRGSSLARSYAAQYYDLSALERFPGVMMELGRFCLHPSHPDPDILRLAWAAMAHLVDQADVRLLFGCSSFVGADPERHAAALGALVGRIAPAMWRPGARAPQRIALERFAGQGTQAEALAKTPALLRTYLGMGGWVSDHAVVDPQMDTLHVLTGVEIANIPPARARALRQIVLDCMG